LGFAKEAASQEGVNLRSLDCWEKQEWPQTDSTVVLDLFGLSPVEYRPFLFTHSKQLATVKRLFIYHCHLQGEEVAAQLQEAGINDGLPLQIWQEYPHETLLEKDEKAMLERLLVFLKEDSERAEKQDAVIFIPADTHARRFAARLGEQLSKNHLKDSVQLISRPNQSVAKGKNCVFLVSSTTQLSEWDYDYGSLFYVLDFQTDTAFRFDYSLSVYLQHVMPCSGTERARRMAVVGSVRIGRYACLSNQLAANPHYVDTATELSTYILRMAQAGVADKLEFNHKRVEECISLLERLGVVKREGKFLLIVDKRVVEATKEGVNPLEAKLVLSILDDSSLRWEQQHRLASLMVMALTVFHTPGTLRQGKQELEEAAHIKPNGIWRKSGYLESCLEILSKYELIEARKTQENSKSQSFRRKTSKYNEY
jgi:hypothetical protein